jgi:hypothetical protein
MSDNGNRDKKVRLPRSRTFLFLKMEKALKSIEINDEAATLLFSRNVL